jgi:four helix bundle protein
MENFDKNEIIQRAYKYSVKIVQLVDKLEKSNLSSSIMARQLMRSGTSIGANIIEAQAASSKKDFANFLNHALKSANESRFWLKLLEETKKIDPNIADELLDETAQFAKILGASVLTLRGKRE